MPIERTDARRFISKGQEQGLLSLRGKLQLIGNRWMIGNDDLSTVLDRYAGAELLVMLGEIIEDEGKPKTCPSCGNTYIGSECPRCSAIRDRFRRR
jgi:rubrerythrin